MNFFFSGNSINRKFSNSLFVIALFPFLSTIFSACRSNNVKVDNELKQHFNKYGAVGCFGMFDNSRGKYTVYNIERFRERYSPASTFKIANALIAMQSGKVRDDSVIIQWDGVQRANEAWNRDMSLYQAFRVSAVPAFQQIAKLIGRDTMQFWLDSLKYGNMKIGPAVDSFWLDQSLQISADEQLGLVKKLYFKQLPFRASVQESVKKMMIQENNSAYQLAFKTGWGTTPSGKPLAWVVGWMEENRHTYPFVLNFEVDASKESEIPEIRKQLLKDILIDLGFYKGRM
ncbi:class D beta-lactamase [Pollutibacter soli]|uniref:class D beta-lactamase n=1 Tax=Pollutibacter soli TaxID=3034157 RepID=UPI0030135B77